MTSPTDELRTAAQSLMDLADAAQEDLDTGDYWKPYDKATAWRDGFANGFGGVSSDLVAVFPPATAQALATWLRKAAEHYDAGFTCCDDGPQHCDEITAPALAVARQVNAAGGGAR